MAVCQATGTVCIHCGIGSTLAAHMCLCMCMHVCMINYGGGGGSISFLVSIVQHFVMCDVLSAVSLLAQGAGTVHI